MTMLGGVINSWIIPPGQIPPHILERVRERRNAAGEPAAAPIMERSVLTDAEALRLRQKVEAVPSETRYKFNRLYLGWKRHIRDNPGIQFSSRTHDYAVGPQMREMEGMGAEIIPLVLEKALGDFFILPLYEKLLADTPYMVDWYGLSGEADRAVRCVKLWLKETDGEGE